MLLLLLLTALAGVPRTDDRPRPIPRQLTAGPRPTRTGSAQLADRFPSLRTAFRASSSSRGAASRGSLATPPAPRRTQAASVELPPVASSRLEALARALPAGKASGTRVERWSFDSTFYEPEAPASGAFAAGELSGELLCLPPAVAPCGSDPAAECSVSIGARWRTSAALELRAEVGLFWDDPQETSLLANLSGDRVFAALSVHLRL